MSRMEVFEFLDLQAVLLALHPALLLWVLCPCHAVRCHSVKVRPLGFVRDDVLFKISPESVSVFNYSLT